MNELFKEDLLKWQRIMDSGERGGLQLSAVDCFRLGVLLETAREKLINMSTMLDIERRTVDALDPEGSRRRMAMQRTNGASPYEERRRLKDRWCAKADD